MNDDDIERFRGIWGEIMMFCTSVSVIRKAQGKLNPSDCEANSADYEKVVNDYVDDLERAIREAWRDRWLDQRR